METLEQQQYRRVAEAIAYLSERHARPPRLADVAERAHASPAHFQRIFSEWAGVSPKKFLQFLTAAEAKRLLREQEAPLAATADALGLSGGSRLHDLLVGAEGMTPDEYRNGGRGLRIAYAWAGTPFGPVLAAATERGICRLAFADDPGLALAELRASFPQAAISEGHSPHHLPALGIFRGGWHDLGAVKLHLRATPFQLKVWECLLRIPEGKLATYSAVAEAIGHPGAARAVGTAIGQNPIAYLIPCHRVIQASGALGGYRWGLPRKTALLGWEASR
jgi:AraC family transcriptional regulator of adaptative response/methylated-DNA-[protein]-cysteine methyltransferase